MIPHKGSTIKTVRGILLIAQNNAFNETNPDITAIANIPKKLVILNNDFVRHDFIVPKLNINSLIYTPGRTS